MSHSVPLLYLGGSGDLLWEGEQKGKPWGSVHPWQRRRHVTREMLRSWPAIALSNLQPFRDLCSSGLRSTEWLLHERQGTRPWICPPLSTRTRKAALTLGGRTAISPKPLPPARNSKAPPKAFHRGLLSSSWKTTGLLSMTTEVIWLSGKKTHNITKWMCGACGAGHY